MIQYLQFFLLTNNFQLLRQLGKINFSGPFIGSREVMICSSNCFFTPSTDTLNSWQLASETATPSDCIKHIAFCWTFIITWSIVAQLNKSFENTDRLIFTSINQKSSFNPIHVIFWHISIHIKEHFYQWTFWLTAGNKYVEVIYKHKLVSHKFLYFGLLCLHLPFIVFKHLWNFVVKVAI